MRAKAVFLVIEPGDAEVTRIWGWLQDTVARLLLVRAQCGKIPSAGLPFVTELQLSLEQPEADWPDTVKAFWARLLEKFQEVFPQAVQEHINYLLGDAAVFAFSGEGSRTFVNYLAQQLAQVISAKFDDTPVGEEGTTNS